MNPVQNNNLLKPPNGITKHQSVADVADTMRPAKNETAEKSQKAKTDSVEISAPAQRVTVSASRQQVDGITETNTGKMLTREEMQVFLKEWVALEEAIDGWGDEARAKGLMDGALGSYIEKKMDDYLAKNPTINELAEKWGMGKLNGKYIGSTLRGIECPSYEEMLARLEVFESTGVSAAISYRPEEKAASGGAKPAQAKAEANSMEEFKQAMKLVQQAHKQWSADILNMEKPSGNTQSIFAKQWNLFARQNPVVLKYFQ